MSEHIPAFSCLNPVEAALTARNNQNTKSIHWRAPLCISKRAELDTVLTDVEVEVFSKYVYWEKQVLIDALESWIRDLREAPCGNLSCPCSSAA